MSIRIVLLCCLLCCIGVADATRPTQRVLLIGNSLIYTRNVPGLLRALAASQAEGPLIETATFVAPGGTLAERWKDGAAAEALRAGRWDVVVLQERGGLLACMASAEERPQTECRASLRAHRQFAELAQSRGARVLLFGTWGPDSNWQQKLDRGLAATTRSTGAEAIELGAMLRAQARRQPSPPMLTDGVHASLEGAVLIAARLYRSITGRAVSAADLELDFALLPANARIRPDMLMEQQPQLAGDGEPLHVPANSIAALLAVANAAP
ncbi:hypothetical protein IP90_02021 [Luteimonas cucumeris]|uniref:SGNH/GDSL hydrolase family protein n=1 Tax=Luteimonas cucumeris TaxID=985012 RepID=A0A562L5H6_9GAMM|nr:SGNH/GDSL hydrolase family protein [Luteimonas cucumeris]TWI02920.1 hypothetical protein IP90_02021 [Luteimonas cucumeris]